MFFFDILTHCIMSKTREKVAILHYSSIAKESMDK